MKTNVENPLAILVGTEMSSVEFVRDYFQLRFDGPCLTAITNPVLFINNKKYTRNDFGFIDLLCSCVSKKVKDAFVDNEKIMLQFEEETSIEISLKQEDRRTTEAAWFTKESNVPMWVW
ncbi:MAG: hypothetical protein HY869_00260 [Chloroflexi bacterium]|nr:hypothetical protein [Chloroflexota bacterium]